MKLLFSLIFLHCLLSRVFTTDQCIHVSLGYLKGLTNEVLPVLSLVEVETKLFSRVLPKVHLHNLLLVVQVSTERWISCIINKNWWISYLGLSCSCAGIMQVMLINQCSQVKFELRNVHFWAERNNMLWESSFKNFLGQKAICKTPTHLFCEAALFICCKENKNSNNCYWSFVPRDAFVLKIQRELYQPKCARKVSNWFPLARWIRSAPLPMQFVSSPQLRVVSHQTDPVL